MHGEQTGLEEDYGYDQGQGHGDTYGEAPPGWHDLPSHVKNAVVHPRLTEEEKFAGKVAAKRRFEMERRHRIFDGKKRTIGVDKPMLDQQVAEATERKRQEAIAAKADDGTMSRCSKELALMELDRQRVQRQMEKACKDYSLNHLSFDKRATYDLNDPLAVRKGVPARLGDTDPRCGPASMQQFNGEDLCKEERTRQQRAAQVNFIEQQKFEKSMLQYQHRGDNEAFTSEVGAITALRDEMDKNESDLRRELQCGQSSSNYQKALDNAAAKAFQRRTENEKNAAELDFHMRDKFLNENSQVMQGPVVNVGMTVEGVDYAALSQNPRLLSDFKQAVTKAIAEEAGVQSSAVKQNLSAGSVQVAATVSCPHGVTNTDLEATLKNSSTLGPRVAAYVMAIPGINAVCTGQIGVTGIFAAKANGNVYRSTYKGSTREEREQVKAIQLQQCAENADKAGEGRWNNIMEHREADATRKHMIAVERQKQQERRRMATELAQHNKQMHSDKKQALKEQDQMYTNEFTPDFFNQFGTHTR